MPWPQRDRRWGAGTTERRWRHPSCSTWLRPSLVFSRALVYGALAAFITAVYIGIVVGVGTLVGSGGRPNLVLSIVATAVVAVGFQPVRERLQKVANPRGLR